MDWSVDVAADISTLHPPVRFSLVGSQTEFNQGSEYVRTAQDTKCVLFIASERRAAKITICVLFIVILIYCLLVLVFYF